MSRPRRLFAIVLLTSGLAACSDEPTESPTEPQLPGTGVRPVGPDAVSAALEAQRRHTESLLATPGVIGTAVALDASGNAVLKVFTEKAGIGGLPATLDQVPVAQAVIGRVYARTDPTTRQRPAPIGFSVGHPAITAGTIGARVINAVGKVYILSNNHVLANANNALPNDPALQPGPLDGGTDPNDRIGTLTDYEPLHLGFGGYGVTPPSNWVDAAIALSSTALLSNSTASDGYGVPSQSLYGDGNGDGVIDATSLLLGLAVQKYGRTTLLTQGQVTEVNVTLDVCYDIFCLTVGRFHDQIGICCAGFSDGGDSGSLIVSADGGRKPVGLLFAGGGNRTFANRIDVVLNRFGVKIDASSPPPPPPPPVTDVAVSAVSAPASATQGSQVTVDVTVQNVGDQDVGAVGVTLNDVTDAVVIGTQTIAGGLAAGASTTLSFGWNTSGRSLGSHTLTATQSLADGDATNDSRSTVVTLAAPPAPTTMHVGDLDGARTVQGRTWTPVITVLVHDGLHAPVPAATVSGAFSGGTAGTRSCTTGSTGVCTITKPKLKSASVTFTVTNVTHLSLAYASGGNHDIDGGTNGTTITVLGP